MAFPKTPLIKEETALSVHTAWRLAGSLMRGLWFIVHITVVLSLSQTHVRQAQAQHLDFCLAQVLVLVQVLSFRPTCTTDFCVFLQFDFVCYYV